MLGSIINFANKIVFQVDQLVTIWTRSTELLPKSKKKNLNARFAKSMKALQLFPVQHVILMLTCHCRQASYLQW
jgi:hypothetical protein